MSNNNKPIGNANLKIQNTFITGCTHRCVSAVIDHERSKTHISAVEIKAAKCRTSEEISQTEVGKASMWLQKSAVDKLVYLFRITHAVVKNDRPLSDYDWLCLLDQNYPVRHKISACLTECQTRVSGISPGLSHHPLQKHKSTWLLIDLQLIDNFLHVI